MKHLNFLRVPLSFYDKSNKIYLIIYIINYFCIQTINIIKLVLLAQLIDSIINNNFALLLIILYVGILILNILLININNYLYQLISNNIVCNIQVDIMNKINKMEYQFIESKDGKDRIDNLKYSANKITQLPFLLISLVVSSYSFVLCITEFSNFYWVYTILYLATAIPGILLNNILFSKIDDLRYDSAPDIRKHSYYKWMLTSRECSKDIRMYSLTNEIKKKYFDMRKVYLQKNRKLEFTGVIFSFLTTLLENIGFILIFYFIISETIKKNISIGECSMYIGLSLSLFASFKTVLSNYSEFAFINKKYVKNYCDFNENFIMENKNGKIKIYDITQIEFLNVSFNYPNSENKVLDNVSFKIEKGEKVALVGLIGAGKTTLIKLLLKMYTPSSGEILVNGINILDIDTDVLRNNISIIFQNFIKYPLTLRENISLSRISEMNDDEKILKSISDIEIYKNNKISLSNLDEYVSKTFSETGIEFSKGELQQLSLARAYFKDAKIYIFDEPSSALDVISEKKVFNDFMNVSKEKLSIMITHRINAGKLFDKIIILENGKLVGIGNHNDLVKNNLHYINLMNIIEESD